MTFLGMMLNGNILTISFPEDKKIRALDLINHMIDQKKTTIKMIQRLTGLLNFLNRAIIPGQTFTRAMYDKLKLKDKNNQPLKQFHHITLDKQFKFDCYVWKEFLMNLGKAALCRPSTDVEAFCYATEQFFYMDASKNASLGMGAVFQNSWMYTAWNKRFIETQDPSIEFLELFALVAHLLTWADRIRNQKLIIFCDNQAVLGMVNNITSKCPYCMKLIRIMALSGLKYNYRVWVKFVPSKQNILADSLSRLDFSRFWKHASSSMELQPCPLPQEIWPMEKVWFM